MVISYIYIYFYISVYLRAIVAPYGPRDDSGEAHPPQKMPVSSSVDNLHQLARGELGFLPVLRRKTVQTHEHQGAEAQLQESFIMGIPTLYAKVQTHPS